MNRYNPDQFFRWLSEPMKKEDINTWYMAHNIIPELNDLFKDFCFSFYLIMEQTYLGEEYKNSKETKITLTEKDNLNHFEWCWHKNLENFTKENIKFKFKKEDYEYFKSFFFEVFYEQDSGLIRKELNHFIKQLFNRKRPISKSDLEMYTDVYKTLERSLQI